VIAADFQGRQRLTERFLMEFGLEAFTDSAWRTIFQAFLDDPELDHVPSDMDPEAARRLETLLADSEELVHPEQTFEDALSHMRLEDLARRRREFDQRIGEAETFEEKQALTVEKAALTQEYRKLAPSWSHTHAERAESRNSTERMG
jgi:hypothetical protein